MNKIGWLLSFSLLWTIGCSQAPNGAPEKYASASQQMKKVKPKQGLIQVEAKFVCMINNQLFDKEQIPIKVQDRTYYGCCAMCKEKLEKDPKSRVAVDPLNNKEVDKAKAIIGADSDGNAYYFESVENLQKFQARFSQ
jgi:YHS domain-containing protein